MAVSTLSVTISFVLTLASNPLIAQVISSNVGFLFTRSNKFSPNLGSLSTCTPRVASKSSASMLSRRMKFSLPQDVLLQPSQLLFFVKFPLLTLKGIRGMIPLLKFSPRSWNAFRSSSTPLHNFVSFPPLSWNISPPSCQPLILAVTLVIPQNTTPFERVGCFATHSLSISGSVQENSPFSYHGSCITFFLSICFLFISDLLNLAISPKMVVSPRHHPRALFTSNSPQRVSIRVST